MRTSSLKSTNEYYPSNNCEILEKNLFDFFAFLREEGLKTGVFNETTRSNIDASYDGGKLVETGTALPLENGFERKLASWQAAVGTRARSSRALTTKRKFNRPSDGFNGIASAPPR